MTKYRGKKNRKYENDTFIEIFLFIALYHLKNKDTGYHVGIFLLSYSSIQDPELAILKCTENRNYAKNSRENIFL